LLLRKGKATHYEVKQSDEQVKTELPYTPVEAMLLPADRGQAKGLEEFSGSF
jgi:hypothetical protein